MGDDYAQAYNAAMGITNTVNGVVQGFDLMTLDGKTYKVPKNLGLVSLDFWSDFGEGFQQGFNIATQVAGQAAPLVGLMGDDYGAAYNAALGVVNPINGMVQSFDLLNLDRMTYKGHQL